MKMGGHGSALNFSASLGVEKSDLRRAVLLEAGSEAREFAPPIGTSQKREKSGPEFGKFF
jgi:hypothetical protein